MDPDDRLRSLLPGMGCTVCGEPIVPDEIRLLAQRDDLTFLQLHCGACGSTTLGIVTAADETGEPDPVADRRDVAGTDGPGRDARLPLADTPPVPSAPPISRADVEAMRDLLAGHRGDLRALLGGADRADTRRGHMHEHGNTPIDGAASEAGDEPDDRGQDRHR